MQQGPFQGLRYPSDKWASGRFEKIIGTYENELFPWLEVIRQKTYSDIINIGTAEGYYAVGLALMHPDAQVTGYELKPDCRSFLLEMANLNGVAQQITMHEGCETSALEGMNPGPNPLVVCDVEGYEKELLQPSVVSWLKCADILLELHDERLPGLSTAIRERFSATHRIHHCLSNGVSYGTTQLSRECPSAKGYALIGEERLTLQHWFFMEHDHPASP